MSCSTHGDESHQLAKNGQEWNSSEGQKTSRMEDSGTGSTRAFEGGSRSRKTTTVGLPGTPEERTKLRHKPSTMERYLDDQYEHWVQSPPPSTFSQSPMDPNLTRPSRVSTWCKNLLETIWFPSGVLVYWRTTVIAENALYCDWLKKWQKDKISISLPCAGTN